MKNPVRHYPIQRKLRLVVLGTCTAALCVASSVLFALQFFFFQRDFRRDLVTVAELIAANSTAALSFHDAEAAHENLASLKAKPQIIGAALVFADGRSLAHVGRVALPGPGDALPELGFQENSDDFVYIHPISIEGELLGRLYLQADYAREARQLHKLYASIFIAVLAVSFFVAVLVSWRLERLILGPIQNLAETARRITTESDYSVRASRVAEDEVGSFTDSFNSMLERIQTRDTALLHEIAERRRAEEELNRTQTELIDASRQAGMAEVATGVLHNVGNVLNSINVSATLIAERLKESRVTNLARAATMLREQNGRLSDYLTNDPKGQLLPAYIADLSADLKNERRETRTEIDLLTRNIEHIKDIVSTQQAYARVPDLTEPLTAAALVEDALRLNLDSFLRHHIILERDFAPVPAVAADKHKALQILVNVLRNAMQAMEEAGDADQRLTIRIRRHDDATVAIDIADTGVGIPPENLTRIFSHGFTTRKDGHGFGLHSAALAARQMAGRLTAHSEGIGRGATFRLEIPISGLVLP